MHTIWINPQGKLPVSTHDTADEPVVFGRFHLRLLKAFDSASTVNEPAELLIRIIVENDDLLAGCLLGCLEDGFRVHDGGGFPP